MRNDIKSSNTLAAHIAAISYAHTVDHSSLGAGIKAGASVDHANASSVSFLISAGTFGASATLNAKLQYSDNGTTWTDYPANDPAGNDAAITAMTAAGSAQLNVVVPRGRYSRVLATVGVAAVVFGVTSVAGPNRHIEP